MPYMNPMGWNQPLYNLTWPMAKLTKLFGDDEYLVGKISRSNGFISGSRTAK